ncbi:Glutaredoxin domain and Thioredoxin-like fold domain-containing protein [Aphelenchoides bicaudatus]|nr:Glutaredoxin domain and Thioredoxin-like fold domain-containing protein [Aphelenchoides bicaudatus]
MVFLSGSLLATATLLVLNAQASNVTISQKQAFDSEELRLRREAWAADDAPSAPDSQLKAFKAGSEKTGSIMGGEPNGYGASYWNMYNTDGQPSMQMWPGGQLGAATASAGQEQLSAYPQSYGTMQNGNPNSPYAGYLEKQIANYPIMIYTLQDCIPCQRAKQLIATSYPDAKAHYLDLSGNEAWQNQLQVDLQYLTGANTFPFIFVSGSYIGGFSELYELHENGQLRRMLNQSLAKGLPKN